MRASTLPVLLMSALGACTPQRSATPSDAQLDATPLALSSPDAPASPLQRGVCPLTVVPGRALGPVALGQAVSSLDQIGLPITRVSRHERTEFVNVGPIRVRACGGHVAEAWLDDLRAAPDCVSVGGKAVERTVARTSLELLFHDCRPLPVRIGGAFTECEKGGVRIGYGLGDFVQVRVAAVGSDIDDECEDVLDDGKPVPVPPTELAKLLQRTLDLDVLAGYWHSDTPNRGVLRIVKVDGLGTPPTSPALSMFGSPVVWIERAQADKDKMPAFEFTSIQSTARSVTISFRYPVEGVVGSAKFQKRHGEWILHGKRVAER